MKTEARPATSVAVLKYLEYKDNKSTLLFVTSDEQLLATEPRPDHDIMNRKDYDPAIMNYSYTTVVYC